MTAKTDIFGKTKHISKYWSHFQKLQTLNRNFSPRFFEIIKKALPSPIKVKRNCFFRPAQPGAARHCKIPV